MAPADVYVKGFTALFTGTFAGLLILGGGRRSAARHLGVFLLLVSLNQTSEAIRGVAARVVMDWSAQVAWFRVATLMAALDPVALFWFAANYPEANELTRSRWLVPILAAGAALALYAGWALPDPTPPAAVFTLTLFTAVVYLGVLAWAIGRFRQEPDARGWRSLVPALSVAALPLSSRLVNDTSALGARPFGNSAAIVVPSLALLLLVGAALVVWTWRDAPIVRRVVLGSVVLTATLVLFQVLFVAEPTIEGYSESATRWVVFVACASMAIFRDRALGWSLHARRRAARVFLGAVFFLVAGLALLALRESLSFTLVDAGFLLVALALSQGFGKLVDEVALRVYGVPRPGDTESAKVVYRRALSEALAQGRDPLRDAELQRLREELSIDATTATLIERVAEETDEEPLRPGRLVQGRYRVDQLIGRGAEGRVLLAWDAWMLRPVVLKELTGAGGEDPLREARIAGSLHHENVVTVHDVVRRPSGWIIVSEHVPGGALSTREGASLGRRFAMEILNGAAAVHAMGIVHGDLKPANILLGASDRPKITDFGLARFRVGTTVTAEVGKAFAGTPTFMAPEQLKGAPATPASDVYALGLILRGAVPLPEAVRGVVDRALRDDPAERWADAGAFRDALAEAWP